MEIYQVERMVLHDGSDDEDDDSSDGDDDDGDGDGDDCVDYLKGCAPCRRPFSMTAWSRQVVRFSVSGSASCWTLCWLAGLWMSALKVFCDVRSGKWQALLDPTLIIWAA